MRQRDGARQGKRSGCGGVVLSSAAAVVVALGWRGWRWMARAAHHVKSSYLSSSRFRQLVAAAALCRFQHASRQLVESPVLYVTC